MKLSKYIFPLAAVTGLIAVLAACAQLQALPSLPATHPESLAAGQQVSCAECHDDSAKGTMKPITSFSHTPAFVKNHRFYVSGDSRLCSTCHKESFCSDCHTGKIEIKPSTLYGNRPDREMPHRGNFMTLHKIEGKLDPASCYRCHGRANNERCIACHR